MKLQKILPLIFFAAAVLGCSSLKEIASKGASNNSGSANSNSASSSAPADSPGGVSPSGDPKADIWKMADLFLAQKAFRTKMTGTGDQPMGMQAEYVAPDRFHIKSDRGVESVIIGKDLYLKTGDTWRKMPGGMGSTLPDIRKLFDEESRKWLSDVRYVGEETANGKPSLVYQYHNKGPGGVGENDSKIWIAKADGLPIKIEATYKSGQLKSMLIEYEFDPSISIEPPVK